jgi:tetratricopeptide (TPR) repeat protein
MDSILNRTEIALTLDDQDDEAYRIRAQVYRAKGDILKAKENYETALNINPNNALALSSAGWFYIYHLNDYVNGLSSYHKAAGVERSPYLAVILRNIAKVYLEFGFIDKANYYNQEATILDTDSLQYYSLLASIVSRQGDQAGCLKYRLKVYSMDTVNSLNLRFLGKLYMDLGQFEEAIKYFEKYLEASNGLIGSHGYRIGYAYWNAGNEEKANYHFNENLHFLNRQNELRTSTSHLKYSYFCLAKTYAFLGEEDKAFENLRIFNHKQTIPYYMVQDIKKTPLFNNIRDEPEFQQIVRDVETRYEATREGVKKWMEENDML